MKHINENFANVSNGSYSVIKPEVTYALATEVTSRERFMALALLQNRCNVNLYSTDVDERLNNVNNMGYIDYYYLPSHLLPFFIVIKFCTTGAAASSLLL